MSRLLLVFLLLLNLPWAQAAERLSPRLTQRLYLILERAGTDPERTLVALGELLESRSMSPTEKGYIAYERAGLLIQQDRAATALDELQDLAEGDAVAFIPRLRRLFAQLLLMENEPAQALAQLEIWRSEVEDPQPAELVMMGYTYLQLDRFAEAAEVLERAISASETLQPQWSELLAYAYTRSGRSDDAIDLLQALISSQPDQARWWRQLASVYLLIEDLSRGTAGLTVATRLESLSFEDARRLAGLFNTLGMPADAAVLFAQAMSRQQEIAPGSVGFDDQMLLGELWMLARELELAVSAFTAAAAIAPGSEPYLKTAQLYLQWERYDEAREALLRAAAAAGESTPGQVTYLLAITEINLGNLSAASELVMRLQREPEFSERADRLSQYLANARRNNP